MAAVGGRIDQHRATHHVAAPQVAVQARRWLGRAGEVGHPLAQPLDRGHAVGGQPRPRGQGHDPRLCSRRPASRAPRRRDLQWPQPQRRRSPPGVPGASVPKPSAPAACMVASIRPRRSASSLRPPSTQASTSTSSRGGQHLGHGCAALAQPAQAGRLGLVGARVAGLRERRRAVVQLQPPGVVQVAAGDRLGGRHLAAQRRGRCAQRVDRTSSSSPRLERSTMSSTSSNPSGPP